MWRTGQGQVMGRGFYEHLKSTVQQAINISHNSISFQHEISVDDICLSIHRQFCLIFQQARALLLVFSVSFRFPIFEITLLIQPQRQAMTMDISLVVQNWAAAFQTVTQEPSLDNMVLPCLYLPCRSFNSFTRPYPDARQGPRRLTLGQAHILPLSALVKSASSVSRLLSKDHCTDICSIGVYVGYLG